VEDKLSGDIIPIGTGAGLVTRQAADAFSIREGIAVCVGMIDAHAALPAAGVVREDSMLMIMGTSNCHMVLDRTEKPVPGIFGIVEDGMIPGYFGYEAGQACCGDHFEWFVKNCVPESYYREAQSRNTDIHGFLSSRASEKKPGETGLLALDWWNGNRSVLMDSSLSGVLIGCTLATKPEDIYRALIEATAFGTRMIVDNYEEHGIGADRIIACGGIALKNDFLMQIYADVTGREIGVLDTMQASALGSAIFGAVAAGKKAGGYDMVQEASAHMAKNCTKTFCPDKKNTETYDLIYREYIRLHDYFGRGGNEVLKKLKKISE